MGESHDQGSPQNGALSDNARTTADVARRVRAPVPGVFAGQAMWSASAPTRARVCAGEAARRPVMRRSRTVPVARILQIKPFLAAGSDGD